MLGGSRLERCEQQESGSRQHYWHGRQSHGRKCKKGIIRITANLARLQEKLYRNKIKVRTEAAVQLAEPGFALDGPCSS